MSIRSFTKSMISITVISCFFIASAFAAGPIPRTDLRLELMVNGSTSDTSGNNRITSYTGTVPSVITDSIYGIKNWNFGGNGSVRVNTSWTASSTADFTMSFWVKTPATNLLNNSSNNFYLMPGGTSVLASNGYSIRGLYYGKPMILISVKNSYQDTTGLAFSVVKEGTCGLNTTYSNSYLGWDTVSLYHYGNYGDIFSFQKLNFACAIADGKWHHVVLTRKAGGFKVVIDGVQAFYNGGTNETIGKVITIGGMGFLPIGTWNYYLPYPASIIADIGNSQYYKGGIFALRVYSVGLSDTDITNLYDEYRYVQGNVTSSTGTISLSVDSYVAPTLKININNIPSNLLASKVLYEYSVNSGSFLTIPSLISLSGTGVVIYQASINLSTVADGLVNVMFRTRTGTTIQDLGSVSYTKIDNPTAITINSPDSTPAPQKYITAQASAGGVLSYALSNGNCDSSLSFEDYTDLTFTTTADNGIRVCYRAVYPNLSNKTIYKLSPSIQGIQPSAVLITTPVLKLFDNYTIWSKSSYPKTNDSTYMMLDLLGVSAASTQGTINGVTMTDINGDGLVDFLYSRNDPIRRAIVVNNGDYTFKVAYKCAIDATGATVYYGDCADFLR